MRAWIDALEVPGLGEVPILLGSGPIERDCLPGDLRLRNRFLDSAAKLANADLWVAGREPMPDVTPHSLRRTFISLLLAAGADVPYVMAQAGPYRSEDDPWLYVQVIASKTDHGAALDGIIGLSALDRESAQRGELLSDANVVSI